MSVDYNEEIEYIFIHNATTEEFADFTFPPNVKSIIIDGDYLDTLIVPQGINAVTVVSLGLRKLIVPDGVEFLYCNYNNLRELELPSTICVADLGNNPLYQLTFRGDPMEMYRLELRNTRLRTLLFKVNPECCIDVHGTALMTGGYMTKEVRNAIHRNPYDGEGFNLE